MKHRHDVALWAGVAALFGNVVALEVVDLLSDSHYLRFGGAVIASLFVGAAVYARERLTDAKAERQSSSPPTPPA